MADFRASIAARQAMGDAATALVDAGATAGHLRIYAGTRPASPNDALTTQVLLADLVMSDPAFAATDANGQAVAGTIASDLAADATGTASFFRISDANGSVIFQGDVTATGGGGDLELATTSISAGIEVAITSLVITVPEI